MLDAILRPRSIAVIGASRRPDTIGFQILDNLVRHGFTGPVYPVNPHATVIHSIRAYPSILDVPEPVDLAIVVVPKEAVFSVAEDCIRKGVRGLVVISAGFREVGGDGEERERQLVELVRRHGVRMVGPNCMGVLNTDPSVSMNATFAPTMPPSGGVALMSQSGAMGLSIIDYADALDFGISAFVSVGNKADVSGNDLLEYWKADPATRVVLFYLESFGNPARFLALAREVTRKKPLFVVKSGRTGAGARAAASHTGSLAGTDAAVDALLVQSGVIRADSVEELFDLAMAFANQPIPRGNRVAIVSNAGGPGIIIADACEANKLAVIELGEETQARLRAALPDEASVRNPVDLIASARAGAYEQALDAVLTDEQIDAAIAAFVPPLGIQAKDVAAAIVRVKQRHPDKPVLAVLMGRQGLPAGLAELHAADIPGYIFPESAARALGAMDRYRRWLERPLGSIVELPSADERIEDLFDRVRAAGRTQLLAPEALELLEAVGMPTAPWAVARDPGEARAAAQRLGGAVALKIVSSRIVHKTDVGGVVLGLRSLAAVEDACHRMLSRVRERTGIDDATVLVQRMVETGREVIVGTSFVPRFGHLVMFGLGGIYVEAMKDVVFRVSPLTDQDAREMPRAIRGAALLAGVRGEASVDFVALEEVLLRVSQLVQRHPVVTELDVNPLMALPDGLVAVDARVSFAAAPAPSRSAEPAAGAVVGR